ncbi:hypothetical protein GH714_037846 [Hevea brasiliensis]|uniref:Vinorine synthase-like n=1 Tax=Hevea brasiliensis TaxID=3981 RepID=A0A6A6LRA6_HEVBR|nr:hypothetical protein GH714_037846 [Hevea brasiliensis]
MMKKLLKLQGLSYIHAAVTDPIFTRIITCETAHEAWEKLKTEFQGFDKTRQMQVFNLIKEFELLRMKNTEKRLVFEASAIASLKAQATSSSMKNPTRVEVVPAFLSERITTMLQAKSSIYHGPIIFAHAVNLRRRALPPFPETSMGNFVWMAHVRSLPEEAKLSSLVCKMREAIRKIDSNFAKNVQGDGGIITVYDRVKEIGRVFSSAVDYVTISSWCNFGLYDVDFGWGKPMWVSGVGLSDDSTTQFLNKVVLMDARMEKGIEAWLLLGEEDIAILEKDKELFAFASLNPSPFN